MVRMGVSATVGRGVSVSAASTVGMMMVGVRAGGMVAVGKGAVVAVAETAVVGCTMTVGTLSSSAQAANSPKTKHKANIFFHITQILLQKDPPEVQALNLTPATISGRVFFIFRQAQDKFWECKLRYPINLVC
jgi:hypothetical protein